jgi:thymidylate synthase (FAD)
MTTTHQSVKLIAVTQPLLPIIEGTAGRAMSADEFIAYTARVSNPSNQNNTKTAQKLLGYLIENEHWSPFEMVSITQEIRTTRDIGRQILRHRSFSFQEFSQRYAAATEFATREARLQDKKNRQNSIDTDDEHTVLWWAEAQRNMNAFAKKYYTEALEKGIAKEQARAVLPEGLTMSTLYMSGTLRSWIHYCQLRMAHGTQKEHMEIARMAWDNICEAFPSIKAYYESKAASDV